MSEKGTLLDSYYQQRIYEVVMGNANTEQEMKLFQMMKPKLFKDGTQWCCLYGDNIQVGIVGFGSSPYHAICAFNVEFYKKQDATKEGS